MAVWKTTFVPENLKADQSQLTNCFGLIQYFACCSLGDSSLQRCLGKPYKERKTHSRISCALTNTHTFAL